MLLPIDDETGTVEVVLRGPAFRRLAPRLAGPGPFVFRGRREEDRGFAHLDVEEVEPFGAGAPARPTGSREAGAGGAETADGIPGGSGGTMPA